MTEQATELEYLRWFYLHADFGPAHEDCMAIMESEFQQQTGKSLPPGYDPAEDLEEIEELQ